MAELLFQSKQDKISDGSPVIITKILGAIDGTTVRQFEDKLIGFFNQGVKNLILIFSDVKYINSTGMGLLVKLADKFQEGGGDIKLVGVPEKVIALFDMLGLLSLFKIYDTEEDAMDSIAPKEKGDAPSVPAPEPKKPPVSKPEDTKKVASSTTAVKPAVPETKKTQPPQPAPVQQPQQQDGGGIDLTEEFRDSGNKPAAPVNWPYTSNCASCGGAIEFAAKGNYKCSRCNSYLSVDDFGQQSVKGAMGHMMETKFPSHIAFIPSVKASINSFAQLMGYSNTFCDEINEALEHAVTIIVEKSNKNSKESFQILTVADNGEMIIGLKSVNPFLASSGPKDPRLPAIARKLDRLEVFPLPTQGQLLKMTKKRK